jgi:hypothetical protein
MPPVHSQRQSSIQLVIAVAAIVLGTPVTAAHSSRAPIVHAARSPLAPADTLHVLLIGNSFTSYNNMPHMLEAISMQPGHQPIRTTMVATGGASLADNWADSLVQQALHARRWDWVIVNDQSTFEETYLVDGKARVHGWTELERSAPRFDSAAHAAGAKFALVMHWADQDAPARDADALTYAFTAVARRLNATVIPIGMVWRAVRLADPAIDLYDPDKHHPSPAGSLLLASSIYATLTDHAPGPGPDTVRGPAIDKPEGHVYPDSIVVLVSLPTATVSALQRAAWQGHQMLLSHHGYPAPTRPDPIALPILPPPAARLTNADLVGTWHGQLRFYPRPVSFTLEVRADGDRLKGALHPLIGDAPARVKDDSVSVRVGDDATLFAMDDSLGPNHTVVRYRGRYHEGNLQGTAAAVSADSALQVFGTWTLKHDR